MLPREILKNGMRRYAFFTILGYKATVIFISVSRHIFLRKATLLTEKKNNPPPPPPPKKKSQCPHTASGHRHAEVQTFVFSLAGIIHISVTVQAKSVT